LKHDNLTDAEIQEIAGGGRLTNVHKFECKSSGERRHD
jgi:hypothetical protein